MSDDKSGGSGEVEISESSVTFEVNDSKSATRVDAQEPEVRSVPVAKSRRMKDAVSAIATAASAATAAIAAPVKSKAAVAATDASVPTNDEADDETDGEEEFPQDDEQHATKTALYERTLCRCCCKSTRSNERNRLTPQSGSERRAMGTEPSCVKCLGYTTLILLGIILAVLVTVLIFYPTRSRIFAATGNAQTFNVDLYLNCTATFPTGPPARFSLIHVVWDSTPYNTWLDGLLARLEPFKLYTSIESSGLEWGRRFAMSSPSYSMLESQPMSPERLHGFTVDTLDPYCMKISALYSPFFNQSSLLFP